MNIPILADRACLDDVALLMREHGQHAGLAAAERADRSRDVGNHIHFCRWRQVERMIELLSTDHAWGTVH
jgi:hypothetical protein